MKTGRRVLLADDAPAVRRGMKALLESEGFEVVGEAEDGQEAVRLTRTLRPDVAILDISMPGLNGLDAAREIQQVCPLTALIFLTVHVEDYLVVNALRSGVRGYVVKGEAAEDLARAIRDVSSGRIFLSPGVSRAIVGLHLPRADCPLVRGRPEEPCLYCGFGSSTAPEPPADSPPAADEGPSPNGERP